VPATSPAPRAAAPPIASAKPAFAKRDPADVVEVDDREREDDAVAERVHDAARLDEPDGTRKVRVEPADVSRQRSHRAL
jgi:hypothetical protein